MVTMQPLTDQIDTIRQIVSENIPWSHRDFMFRFPDFIKADRSLWANDLTRNLDTEHDLRFIYRDKNNTLVLLCEILPWDTAFFGYKVARLHLILPYDAPFTRPHADFSSAVQALVKEAKARGVRYLFASVFPEDLATIRALNTSGFSLIETRAYYHRSLKDYDFPRRFSVRLATPDDIDSLSTAAVEMVNEYDRFHADPMIAKSDADRMMRQWIKASLTEGFADATLVPDVDQPGAFCTLKYHRGHWDEWGVRLGQPVFSAVSHEFRGWYVKIISETCFHLKDIGAEHNYLITQVTNRAVIRSWEKLGYQFGRAEHIFRIVI